jgi:putative redox protein
VEIFKRTIQLLGNIDAEQRDRLLEIANKCPVHKALVGKIEINTTLL